MEFKKTTKYDVKEKSLKVVDGNIINSDGEIINLGKMLESVYGNSEFDLSTTAKLEEVYDLDAVQ